MLNLLIKKIKNNKSIFFSSSFLLFTLFATLNILFLFCWNFFSAIYLYSSGYSDSSYYSINKVDYENLEKEYNVINLRALQRNDYPRRFHMGLPLF